MTLANTFGTGLIQAASNIGYHPKWLLEGNQTTDTVLKFFDSVKDDLDGSVGHGLRVQGCRPTSRRATECNKIVTDRSGEVYEPGSDAFGFAAVVCHEFRYVDAGRRQDRQGEAEPGRAHLAASRGSAPSRSAIGPDGHAVADEARRARLHVPVRRRRGDAGKCVRSVRATPIRSPGLTVPADARRLRRHRRGARGDGARRGGPPPRRSSRRPSGSSSPTTCFRASGAASMSMGQALRAGGAALVVTLGVARFVDVARPRGDERPRPGHPEDARRERRGDRRRSAARSGCCSSSARSRSARWPTATPES